jgi:hypothetical protein
LGGVEAASSGVESIAISVKRRRGKEKGGEKYLVLELQEAWTRVS